MDAFFVAVALELTTIPSIAEELPHLGFMVDKVAIASLGDSQNFKKLVPVLFSKRKEESLDSSQFF